MTSNKKIVRTQQRQKNEEQSLRNRKEIRQDREKKQQRKENTVSLPIHQLANSQQDNHQEILMNLCQIYKKLFGSDELMAQFQDSSNIKNSQMTEITEKVKQQIDRLHGIEYQFYQYTQIFQGNQSKLSNQQKWKLVVLSYREKIKNLQMKIREERSSRLMLQETIKISMQEKERLSQLNNIKHKKINTLVSSLEQKELQLIELNQSIAQMSAHIQQINFSNLSLKQSNNILQQQITQLNSIRIQQSQQLQQKQRLLVNPQCSKQTIDMNVLGQEELEVHKQIADLKTKYQIQIAKLEYQISNLVISNKQDLQTIQQLRSRIQMFEMVKLTSIDEQTQTQTQVVKACFFNSLAQDLDDQYDNSVVDSESFRACDQENKSEGDDQFHIPIGSHSKQCNLTFTDRSVEINYQRDTMSEREIAHQNLQMSFDDQRSLSNTPSKYVETMSQLTAELAEAYQKINTLTSKVGQLEEQRNKIEHKIKDHEVRRQKPKEKTGMGYFSSFFKK